jgi:hypothetical protein
MGNRLELVLQGDDGVRSHVFAEVEEVTVGRSSGSMLHIDHASVSRQHAVLRLREGDWEIEDLESRHGTWVNGRRLRGGDRAIVATGDVVQIRPWSLLVRRAGSTLGVRNKDEAEGTFVRPTPAPFVQERFTALLEVVREMHSAANEDEIAFRIIDAVVRTADLDRVGIVRLVDGEIEALAVRLGDVGGESMKTTPFSRTLVRAAIEAGTSIRLDEFPEMLGAESLANAGVSKALCVPIDVGDGLEHVLYADARGGSLEDGELVAWCEALARVHEIAIGSFRREGAEADRARLMGEMSAARAAQELMLPVREGAHGAYTWAVSASPGLEVAGDMVDLAPRDDGSIGLLVGDVAGKGARAGFVMASIQAYSHAVREQGGSLNDLLGALDAWAEEVVPEDVFITLWCGRLLESGVARYIDAGHGMTFVVGVEGAVRRVPGPHRPPVGAARVEAEASEFVLEAGETLVLMSDGIVEQPREDGERFGEARVEEELGKSVAPEALVEAVRAWSGRASFDDDITVVSITYSPTQ